MTDTRLKPIKPMIRDLEQEIDDLMWNIEGVAPEKLQDKLQELKFLQRMERDGELYIPNF